MPTGHLCRRWNGQWCTPVTASLFSIALSLHTHHTDWYFLWHGKWLFSPLTDGCRSTVSGTNVWKLFSDEYGDYNVTRDLHMFFSRLRGFFYLSTDDGLWYICFSDVSSNARKLFQVEVHDDYGDHSDIREPCARPVTSCDAAHDFEFGVKNPMGRRRAVYDLSFLSFFACCEL